MVRVYEILVVLILFVILVISIVWVGLVLIDRGRIIDEGNYNEFWLVIIFYYL